MCIRDRFKEQSAARGEQTGIIDEMVGNQKVVQAFGYQERAQGRFDAVSYTHLDVYKRQKENIYRAG